MLDRTTEDMVPPEISTSAAETSAPKELSDQNGSPAQLTSGLNIVKPKATTGQQQAPSSHRQVQRASRYEPYQKDRNRSVETSKILKQYEERESSLRRQTEIKNKHIHTAATSSKSKDAVAKARERYLQRKKEQSNSLN